VYEAEWRIVIGSPGWEEQIRLRALAELAKEIMERLDTAITQAGST
jgi:hypothetical protein